jgi:Protein of unknown function (DUF3307)
LILIYIFFLHWVGDFLFQTNWMATNKSHNFIALITHVSIYTLTLTLGTIIVFNFKFLLINFIAHGLTDFLTSKVTSKLWQRNDIHNFFVVVGFDQYIHAVTLILTVESILNK